MCRFLVYVGCCPVLMADLLTRPSHSIIQQSWDSRERMTAGPLNGDGFGVGWYTAFDPTPCIFTSINPAWNNLNLRRYPSPHPQFYLPPFTHLILVCVFTIQNCRESDVSSDLCTCESCQLRYALCPYSRVTFFFLKRVAKQEVMRMNVRRRVLSNFVF